MHFLSQYGLFLLQTVTLLAAILIGFAGIMALRQRKKTSEATINITKLNEEYDEMKSSLQSEVLDKKAFKQYKKALKKSEAAKDKKTKKRVYVLNFEGDIRASAVEQLREEISAILLIATPEDEVVVNIDSGGGVVHGYGLGASQLQRIRDKKIPLTVCIDKVAASGGYLMACVADKILAAPFAIIGSIGVVMQLPNVHRLLKKHDIDYETLTSGEYKRTMTIFGENTEKGREKCLAELEEIHVIFKDHIAAHRPHVKIASIGTGEHWLASKALELQLVDALTTSDAYLMQQCEDKDVFEISLEKKKTLLEKLSSSMSLSVSQLFTDVKHVSHRNFNNLMIE